MAIGGQVPENQTTLHSKPPREPATMFHTVQNPSPRTAVRGSLLGLRCLNSVGSFSAQPASSPITQDLSHL